MAFLMGFLQNLFWMLFSFEGRLSRRGYSLGVLLSEGVIIAFSAAIEPFVKNSHSAAVVWIISTECLLLIWTNLALKAKRIHDCGFNGLWALPCSPVCLFLFLYIYNYTYPPLMIAVCLASVIAIVFMTMFRDEQSNIYGTPGNEIFPRHSPGHTPLKQLSDKLEVLDRMLAERKLSPQQHAEACEKLIEANKALLE